MFIPFKRDKNGRRFGFVRFIPVKNVDVLATRLNNIFIDDQKIFVNIPIFPRSRDGFKGGGGVGQKSFQEGAMTSRSKLDKGRNYAIAVARGVHRSVWIEFSQNHYPTHTGYTDLREVK